ncbi:hypothetical protein BJX62DRAFT_197131 [Aspergillus germanicus]
MPLLALPSELFLLIAEHIDSESDLSSFLRANHRLHDLLVGSLYQKNIKNYNSFCLHWAAESGSLFTAHKAIAQGPDIHTARAFVPPGVEVVKLATDVKVFLPGAGIEYHLAGPRAPLFRAARSGQKEILIALLDAGADVNAEAHVDSHNPRQS